MEAFEHLVKVYLETQGYVVTTNVKFPVRRRTKKVAYPEYQTHSYEVDIVAARHDSLILGSVKSFFGSGGIHRSGFPGLAADVAPKFHRPYAMFTDPDLRMGLRNAAAAQYGYPKSEVEFKLFVGKFRKGHQEEITDHLDKLSVGVVDINEIVSGVLKAAEKTAYYNDPVIVTIKALREAGFQLGHTE